MTALPRDYPTCPLADQGCNETTPHRHGDGPLGVARPLGEVPEPMLISGMRRYPDGIVEHRPEHRGKSGTTTLGFLMEFDAYVEAVRKQAAGEPRPQLSGDLVRATAAAFDAGAPDFDDPEDGAAEYVAREHRVMHVDREARIVCLCGDTFAKIAVGMSEGTAAYYYGQHLREERERYVARQEM